MLCPAREASQLVMSERKGIEVDYCPLRRRSVWRSAGVAAVAASSGSCGSSNRRARHRSPPRRARWPTSGNSTSLSRAAVRS